MATRRKSATKSAKPELVAQPNGKGALLTGGMPGNKGGGRPKDEFKAMMRELASSDLTIAQVRAILKDSDSVHFMKALAYATEHGYGKATENIDVNQKTTTFVVHVAPKGSNPTAWQRQYSKN